MEKKKPLIILTGPTAVGKSALSISLAHKIGGEIISADSVQVYKRMNVGSDKITTDKMDGISHHLIDVLEPTEEFNVVLFKEMAKKCIDDIVSRGKIPIIVGGTGFYIQAVLYDIDFTATDSDTAFRDQLEKTASIKGNEYLHAILQNVDPDSAAIIHPNNTKRVIRALEYNYKTGEQISKHNELEHNKISPYDFRYFVLTDDRDILYSRIDKRVDKMLDEGLVDEVRSLIESGVNADMTSMQGLGYKEIVRYLNGEYDLERAIYLIKQGTRHFAKRQLSWFRREKEVIWIDKNDFGHDDEAIIKEILNKSKDIL